MEESGDVMEAQNLYETSLQIVPSDPDCLASYASLLHEEHGDLDR